MSLLVYNYLDKQLHSLYTIEQLLHKGCIDILNKGQLPFQAPFDNVHPIRYMRKLQILKILDTFSALSKMGTLCELKKFRNKTRTVKYLGYIYVLQEFLKTLNL